VQKNESHNFLMAVIAETKAVPISSISIEGYGTISESKLKKAVAGFSHSNGGLNLNILREIAKLCKIKGRSKIKRPELEVKIRRLYFPVKVSVRPSMPVKPIKPIKPCNPVSDGRMGLYESLMSNIQYQTLDKLTTKTKEACTNTKVMARHHKRLMTDISFLCTYGSSVFIRSSEGDMSTIQFMISGPQGTPYQNGLFHFTLSMSTGFPTNPPEVKILNTDRGRIRHNPNLYACGKVCLSILNTWTGGARWTAKTSLNDVIMGIQNYVLSEQPWANEPGHAENKKSCKAYNHIIRLSTMIEGMYDMLLSPPEGFTDIVLFHFYGPKKVEILQQLRLWKMELCSLKDSDVVGYMKSYTHYSSESQFKKLFRETVEKLESLYQKVLN